MVVWAGGPETQTLGLVTPAVSPAQLPATYQAALFPVEIGSPLAGGDPGAQRRPETC